MEEELHGRWSDPWAGDDARAVARHRVCRGSVPRQRTTLTEWRRRFIGNRAGEGLCTLTALGTAQSSHLNDPQWNVPSGLVNPWCEQPQKI